MPPGARQSPPPPDGVLELLRKLRALEDAGETSDLRLGPLSGYLMLAGLTGAMRAPRVTGSLLKVGDRVRGEIRRAAGVPVLDLPDSQTLASVYMRLDELSESAGPDAALPGGGFVELITLLQHLEQENVRLDVHIGPFTLFYAIGLLQLALRHPSASMEPSPVEVIARGLTQNFGGYARELLERGFDPRFDTDADGRPLHPEHYAGDPAFAAAGADTDDDTGEEGTALLVGLGPGLIYDVVSVAMAACPGCGENPEFAISAEQAVCGNDECRVFFWNPQQTAEEFWSSAVEQVLARDPKTGIVRNVDADAVPEGYEVVGASLSDVLHFRGGSASGEHVDEQRDGQQGHHAEDD